MLVRAKETIKNNNRRALAAGDTAPATRQGDRWVQIRWDADSPGTRGSYSTPTGLLDMVPIDAVEIVGYDPSADYEGEQTRALDGAPAVDYVTQRWLIEGGHKAVGPREQYTPGLDPAPECHHPPRSLRWVDGALACSECGRRWGTPGGLPKIEADKLIAGARDVLGRDASDKDKAVMLRRLIEDGAPETVTMPSEDGGPPWSLAFDVDAKPVYAPTYGSEPGPFDYLTSLSAAVMPAMITPDRDALDEMLAMDCDEMIPLDEEPTP
jgi:hypothetical protein